MKTQIEKYVSLTDEKAVAVYSDIGPEKIFEEARKDFENDTANVWNRAKKIEILKSYITLKDFPKQANQPKRYRPRVTRLCSRPYIP